MHHVRTLKILLQVYMYELRRSQLIEDAKLEQLFLSVEELLSLHQHFLSCLKARQKEAQPEESPNNYQITQFGDILVSQVDARDIRDGQTLLLSSSLQAAVFSSCAVVILSFQVRWENEWSSLTACSAAITTSP